MEPPFFWGGVHSTAIFRIVITMSLFGADYNHYLLVGMDMKKRDVHVCVAFLYWMGSGYLLTLNFSFPFLMKSTICLAAAIPALVLASVV